MRRLNVKASSRARGSRIALLGRLAKQMVTVEKLAYERVEADLQRAREAFEIAKEEAKRAAARRDAARRHLNELDRSLRAIKPKHERKTTQFERLFEQALAARCGDLKQVPRPLERALSRVQEQQQKRDLDDATQDARKRISAAASFQEGLKVLGVEPEASIPAEREREWRDKSARVRLVAAVLKRRGNLNELQMQIVFPYLASPNELE